MEPARQTKVKKDSQLQTELNLDDHYEDIELPRENAKPMVTVSPTIDHSKGIPNPSFCPIK